MLEYVLTDEGSDIILNDLCQRLKAGQVGILPTETVYGLVCLAGHEEARKRICDLKAREGNKPMQFLIDNIDHCSWLDIDVSPTLKKLADAFWPGPLTVVVTNKDGDYVGIRVPRNDFICSMIDQLGSPLTATSANVSGEDPEDHLRRGFKGLNGEPDFALLSGRGEGISSTVLRLHSDDSYEILREGSISSADVAAVLKGSDA
jgi:L-threonylcarbamoyladenylate synthase